MKVSWTVRLVLLTTAGLMAVSSTGMAAASGTNFQKLFDSANNIYQSLQNVSTQHDKLLKTHHGSCGSFRRAEAGKWWVTREKQDSAAISGLSNKLSKATTKQRKKKVYRDFVKSINDLKNWNNRKVKAHLLTCSKSAESSSTVDQDMSNLSSDLGMGSY